MYVVRAHVCATKQCSVLREGSWVKAKYRLVVHANAATQYTNLESALNHELLN